MSITHSFQVGSLYAMVVKGSKSVWAGAQFRPPKIKSLEEGSADEYRQVCSKKFPCSRNAQQLVCQDF